MQTVAHERYEDFDKKRRASEARVADMEDLMEIEQLENELKQLDKKD